MNRNVKMYKPVFKSRDGREAILKVYDSLLARWPVPYEALNISTRYGDTHIIACGDSSLPPLVLLHGTSSNSTMWIGDIIEYSKSFRVYAVDIPGEPGKSGERQYPLKGPFYHEWLEDVFSELQFKKASLLGISLGGWVAVNYSVRHPEKIERLVLLCPSGIGPQKISFIFKSIPLMLLGEKGFDKASRLVNGNNPIPEEALQYMKLIGRNFNLRTIVPVFSDGELKRLTMPILLLAGEKDVLIHSEKTAARLKKLLPKSTIELLPKEGHILINYSGRILEFLSQEKADS
ncbi:MAG: alpha/beta hydrolase [Clostridia bacterium]|nr:alpha/beta hydrolase [Clostridia bacterium]